MPSRYSAEELSTSLLAATKQDPGQAFLLHEEFIYKKICLSTAMCFLLWLSSASIFVSISILFAGSPWLGLSFAGASTYYYLVYSHDLKTHGQVRQVIYDKIVKDLNHQKRKE